MSFVVRLATAEEWREHVAIPAHRYRKVGGWVAELDGEPYGHVFASTIDGVLWLHDLLIPKSIAILTAQLILAVRHDLRALKIDTVNAMVPFDSPIRRLYARAGFKEIEILVQGRLT